MKVEGRLEGISNPKDFGDAMNDEVKTYEENHKVDVSWKRDSGMYIREWKLYRTKGTCVIWCARMPFWHLVVRAVGLRVTCIWGGSEVRRRQ